MSEVDGEPRGGRYRFSSLRNGGRIPCLLGSSQVRTTRNAQSTAMAMTATRRLDPRLLWAVTVAWLALSTAYEDSA